MRSQGARKKGSKFKQFTVLIMVGVVFTMGLVFVVSTIGGQEFGPLHKLALEVSAPLFKVASKITGVLDGVKQKYQGFMGVREENERLWQQLKESRADAYNYREALATNARLKKLLEFKEQSALPMIGANVVGKDPSLWFRTLVIDRGANDGVSSGMPVVNGDGVVGQVIRVSPGYAKVLLAIAPSSAIDVVLQKSRARGILKGNGSLSFRLEYILKNIEVAEGEFVVTAGYGGVFPQGLPVGVVSRVEQQQRGMFQEIEVKPAVDFLTLENLLVIEQQHPFAE